MSGGEFIPALSRRQRRAERKLMKVEAEYRLVASSGKKELSSPQLDSPSAETNVDDQRQRILDLKKIKDASIVPKFYLNAVAGDEDGEIDDGDVIDLKDIYALIWFSIIGSKTPTKSRRFSLTAWRNVSQAIFVVVDQDSVTDSTMSKFPFVVGNFLRRFDVRLPEKRGDTDFYKGLFRTKMDLVDQLREAFEEKEKQKREELTSEIGTSGNKLSKLDLLLSPLEMVEEFFPLPPDFPFNGRERFIYSRKTYSSPTNQSPIYAIDCEMCTTGQAHRELTRISIVDEQCQIVLDTLVKPEHPITDYLTRWSGITPAMMKGVTTKLSDVQRSLEQLLEPDAILCGHSLNHDLQSIRIFHPHVIDTSLAFNLSGRRKQKSKLSALASLFLEGMAIQQSNNGHCSVEDAFATMRLLKKKLFEIERSDGDPAFGNVMHGWDLKNYEDIKRNNRKRKLEAADDEDGPSAKKRRAIGAVSATTVNCGGCRQGSPFNCRNNNCRCRSLDRISCHSCLLTRLVDQTKIGQSVDAGTFVKSVYPVAESINEQDELTVNATNILKKHKKKLLYIQDQDRSTESFLNGGDSEWIKHLILKPIEHKDVNDEVVKQFQSRMYEYNLNVLELNGRKVQESILDAQIASIVKYSASKSLICVLFCDRRNDHGGNLFGKCYMKVKE